MRLACFVYTLVSSEPSSSVFVRKYYEGRIGEVYEILRAGSEAAREVAAETLADVKRAMKIDYFDDKELIASQAEHFAHKE